MRTFVYAQLLWVAVLRVTLAPCPAELVDDVSVCLRSAADAPTAARFAAPARFDDGAAMDVDSSLPDEAQPAQADSGEDEDLLLDAAANGRLDPPRVGTRTPARHVEAPPGASSRLDRPPRVGRA